MRESELWILNYEKKLKMWIIIYRIMVILKENNKLTNLEWLSHKDNCKNKILKGPTTRRVWALIYKRA